MVNLVAKNYFAAVMLCATIGLGAQSAFAANCAASIEISPEVTASVWQEEGQERAAVSINGREFLTYKAQSGSGVAEQKAEDLAGKLQELINSDKLDANKLVPAKEGELAAIRVDGNTVCKFEIPEGDNISVLDQCMKIVNLIRNAVGAPALPAAFFKLANAGNNDQSQAGCFSGHASWYGGKFHGRRTSDGSRFDQDGLTAAHRSLPFGTKLLVMNRRTGNSCVVQVNDRGPFIDGRIIDLSRGAAKRLNMLGSGVAMVDCLVLGDR